jgi:hypothetical protein
MFCEDAPQVIPVTITKMLQTFHPKGDSQCRQRFRVVRCDTFILVAKHKFAQVKH